MWQQTHMQKTVQNFFAMPVALKQNTVYTFPLLPYCFLNPMALLQNEYVKLGRSNSLC